MKLPGGMCAIDQCEDTRRARKQADLLDQQGKRSGRSDVAKENYPGVRSYTPPKLLYDLF